MQTKLLLTFVLATAWFSAAAGASELVTSPMRVLDAKAIIKEVTANKAKVKVVNVWASWCAPCLKELPGFAKAESKLKDVAFFYVSGDDEKDAATAEKFIQNAGVKGTKFRLAPISEAAFHDFSNSWSGSLPTTFIYYEGFLTDQSSKPLTEKRLLEWVKFRLNHPPTNSLHPEPSSPKINSSQGKK
jgi:thiol-disulfide isomerase/thioredoxin